MSTRSNIAFLNDNGTYTATYHHWDGYPTALGATLWSLYHEQFDRDVAAMRRILIDEHPAGWSTINDRDFSIEPGFWNLNHVYQNGAYPDNRPLCYCHGDRSETDSAHFTIDASTDPGQFEEWVYWLTVDGLGVSPVIWGRGPAEPTWFSWNGPEPNWEGLEDR